MKMGREYDQINQRRCRTTCTEVTSEEMMWKKQVWSVFRRAQGASLETELQTAARSLGVASAGPEKHIPTRGKG